MNHMILAWLKKYHDPEAFAVKEVKTRVQGVRGTEFSLHIDYKNSPSLITSMSVYGHDLENLWRFLTGTETEDQSR
jgi:hypothetical protein